MSLVFFAISCTISWSLVSQFSSIRVSRHRNKAAKALQHEFCSQDDGILMFCLSKANWQRWDYQLLLSEHQKRLLHSWKACHSFKSACLISNICQSMVTYKVKTYSKVKNSNSNWHFEAQLICHEVELRYVKNYQAMPLFFPEFLKILQKRLPTVGIFQPSTPGMPWLTPL